MDTGRSEESTSHAVTLVRQGSRAPARWCRPLGHERQEYRPSCRYACRHTARSTIYRLVLTLMLLGPASCTCRPAAVQLIPPAYSSHSLASEVVVPALLPGAIMPRLALLGSLEARIYRCECGSGIHLWDVAGGLPSAHSSAWS